MQFYYDDKMPLRILDEGEFWKQQESEHTVVIRELVSNLEKEYVEALEAWEQSFAQTQALFTRYIETAVRSGHHLNKGFLFQIRQLVEFSLQQSQQFILLLNTLGLESEAIRSNPTAIVVLNHIRRESEYFIGITRLFYLAKYFKQTADGCLFFNTLKLLECQENAERSRGQV